MAYESEIADDWVWLPNTDRRTLKKYCPDFPAWGYTKIERADRFQGRDRRHTNFTRHQNILTEVVYGDDVMNVFLIVRKLIPGWVRCPRDHRFLTPCDRIEDPGLDRDFGWVDDHMIIKRDYDEIHQLTRVDRDVVRAAWERIKKEGPF